MFLRISIGTHAPDLSTLDDGRSPLIVKLLSLLCPTEQVALELVPPPFAAKLRAFDPGVVKLLWGLIPSTRIGPNGRQIARPSAS
jgi:hypothetical protein